eukprot:1925790-Lingulodinium_polyedra.AAC.1
MRIGLDATGFEWTRAQFRGARKTYARASSCATLKRRNAYSTASLRAVEITAQRCGRTRAAPLQRCAIPLARAHHART